MKISIVQDAIIFVSALTREEFEKAVRFCPESLTLHKPVDGDSKKKTPVCTICYGENGAPSANGIVFDSVTDTGNMCVTLVTQTGFTEPPTPEVKKQAVTEEYAGLILKVNELEAQVKAALEAKSAEIEQALESVDVVSL